MQMSHIWIGDAFWCNSSVNNAIKSTIFLPASFSTCLVPTSNNQVEVPIDAAT